MYHNKVTLLLKGIHRKAILPLKVTLLHNRHIQHNKDMHHLKVILRLKVTLLLNRHMYPNKATHRNKGIHRNSDIFLGQR